jgi:hypothetical protein
MAGAGYLLPGESDAHGVPSMAFSNPLAVSVHDLV